MVDIASAIGESADAARKTCDAAIQEKLGILVACFPRVYELMEHDKIAVRRWMRRPNPGHDG